MSEFIIDFCKFLYKNISTLLVMCSAFLFLRAIFIFFGFEILLVAIAVVMLIASFLIDFYASKREVKKQYEIRNQKQSSEFRNAQR